MTLSEINSHPLVIAATKQAKKSQHSRIYKSQELEDRSKATRKARARGRAGLLSRRVELDNGTRGVVSTCFTEYEYELLTKGVVSYFNISQVTKIID